MLPGISPIVETRASWLQVKSLPFNKLGLDRGLHSLYRNFIQTKTMGELMYQENIYEEAVREERTRIAGELDTLLQTFLSASMQLAWRRRACLPIHRSSHDWIEFFR